jgi:hypothetical protein
MSKKEQLLTEAQVRKFMKLANLPAITPGFVHGLHEGDLDYTMTQGGKTTTHKVSDDPGAHNITADKPKKKTKKDSPEDTEPVAESHGRGPDEGPEGYGKPDQNARSRNENLGLEDEHDLENAEDDLEHADDLDVDAEEDLGDLGDLGLEDDLGADVGGREVSVDDFLAALEVALEDVLGDEVEVDQEEEEVEDEEVELPLGDDEDLSVGLEVEEEPALQEVINQITRRVAKRIVKEALQGKK